MKSTANKQKYVDKFKVKNEDLRSTSNMDKKLSSSTDEVKGGLVQKYEYYECYMSEDECQGSTLSLSETLVVLS